MKQRLEATGYTVSMTKKQKAMNARTLFTFSFLLHLNPSLMVVSVVGKGSLPTKINPIKKLPPKHMYRVITQIVHDSVRLTTSINNHINLKFSVLTVLILTQCVNNQRTKANKVRNYSGFSMCHKTICRNGH